MKRFQCGCLVLMLAVIATLPVHAEKATSLYKKGEKAEARQNYDEAYSDYKGAYNQHPENTSYRAAYERIKFTAASAHVHKGEMLRNDGKLSEALKEFLQAATIDSSSMIAAQEVESTKKLIEKAQQPASAPPASEEHPPGGASFSNLAGPVQLIPISRTPLSLKLSEDTKTVYETIGKLAGINVLFDPEYTSKKIQIELNSVSLEDALQILAMESHTFWRPVTPNTIYIAQDNQTKRTELEQQVLRTFYLSNFSTVSELQDVANLVRTILRVERVQQFPAENAIVMRGTPDQIALAELLINNLDKAKPEVVVDVLVMQVSKNKMRQLGIQPPQSATVTLQNPTAITSTTSSSSTPTSTTGLTLNSLTKLNATDFAVSIPSATVNALLSNSDAKVLQQPQIRSLDGEKAVLKIGERVPIAVGTSSSTLTATALTQTQFQYQDVGVNIEMTPHVHSDNEVSLKISLEVSDIDSYQSIGGLNEPVIGQRKIDHEIRLRDGEVSLIGGMMEHDDTKSMSGLPGLAQIPILKYLFGSETRSKTDNETVFCLIPHVVRRLDFNDLSRRPVDIGTANVLTVRHIEPSPEASAAAPVPSGEPSRAPAPPPAPAPAPAPMSAPAPAPAPAKPTAQATQPAILSLDPPLMNEPAGATFSVNVVLNGARNVFSVPVQVSYDSKVLQFVNVSDGGALSKDGSAVTLVHRDDASRGALQVSLMRAPGSGGTAPLGPVFTLTFVAKAAGQGTVSVDKAKLLDPGNAEIEASGSQAIVNVR